MADLNNILSLTGAKIRTAAKKGDTSLVIEWAHALTTGVVPSLPPYSWVHIGTSNLRTVAVGSEDTQTSFRAAPRFDSTGTHYYVLSLVTALTEDHGVGDAIAFYPQIIRTSSPLPSSVLTSIGVPAEIDYRPFYEIAGPSTPVSIHSVPTAEFKLLTSPAGHVTVAPKQFPTGATLEAGSIAVTLQIYPGYNYYKALTITFPLTGVPSDIEQFAPFPVIKPTPGQAGRYVLRTTNYLRDPDGGTITISGYFPTTNYSWLLPVRPSSQSIVFAWSNQSRIGQNIHARVTMTKAVAGFTPKDYDITLVPAANQPPLFVRAQPHRSIKAGRGSGILVKGSFADPEGGPLRLSLRSLSGRVVQVRGTDGKYTGSKTVPVPSSGYLAIRGRADGVGTLRLTATDDRGASNHYDFTVTVEDPPTTTYNNRNPYEFDVTISKPFELNLDDYFVANTPDDSLVYSLVRDSRQFGEEIIGNRLRITAEVIPPGRRPISVRGTNPRGSRVDAYFLPTVLVPDIATFPPLSANYVTRMFRKYGVDAEVRDDKGALVETTRVILQGTTSTRLLDETLPTPEYTYYNEMVILSKRPYPVGFTLHALGTSSTILTINTITARGHVIYYSNACQRAALVISPVQPSEDLQFGAVWEPTYAEVGRLFSYVSPRVAGPGITHSIAGLPAGLAYDADSGAISGRPFGLLAGLSFTTGGDLIGNVHAGGSPVITLTATHTDGRSVQLSGPLNIAEAGTRVPYALEMAAIYRSLGRVITQEQFGWTAIRFEEPLQILGNPFTGFSLMFLLPNNQVDQLMRNAMSLLRTYLNLDDKKLPGHVEKAFADATSGALPLQLIQGSRFYTSSRRIEGRSITTLTVFLGGGISFGNVVANELVAWGTEPKTQDQYGPRTPTT